VSPRKNVQSERKMFTTNIEKAMLMKRVHESYSPKLFLAAGHGWGHLQVMRAYAANRRAQRMLRFDIFAFVSRLLDSPAVHCTPAAIG